MKKLLLALALLMVCASAMAAGIAFNNPYNRIYWGVRVQGDINMPGDWVSDGGYKVNMYDGKGGVAAGAICNIPLVANLYLEPGVGLFFDRYRYDLTIMDGGGTGAGIVDPPFYKVGFRVPVMLGYRVDFSAPVSVSLFTGPELNYAFAGKTEFSKEEKEMIGEEDLEMVQNIFGPEAQRRVSLAWNVGVSVEFDYRWVVGVYGSFGLTDQMSSAWKFHDNRLSLSLGYNF